MYTNANLRVYLDHRGQAVTGVERWRVAVGDEKARLESIAWLEGRLSPGLLPDAMKRTSGSPTLVWRGDGRRLHLIFESPHDVVFAKFDGGKVVGVGDFNLAMNLHEIIDMVRWAVEGR